MSPSGDKFMVMLLIKFKRFAKAPVFDVEEDDEEEEDLHNFAGDGFDAADEDEDADGFDVNPSQVVHSANLMD